MVQLKNDLEKRLENISKLQEDSERDTVRPKTFMLQIRLATERQRRHLSAPWSGVFLKKLLVAEVIKEFPVCCGHERLIGMFRRAHTLEI
jgi:hypothetical protein